MHIFILSGRQDIAKTEAIVSHPIVFMKTTLSTYFYKLEVLREQEYLDFGERMI